LDCPSKYFIKYLLSDRTLELSEVIRILEDYHVVYLPGRAVDYLRKLLEGMHFPPNFDPKNPSHTPSMDFLRREGIYEMWYPTQSTRKAIEIQRSPEMRELVMALLSTPISLKEACDFLVERGIDVDIATLQEYRHYFWNLALLTQAERSQIAKVPITGQMVSAAISCYKDSLGARVLLWKMGYSPPSLDKETIFVTLRDLAFYNALDTDRNMKQGNRKAVALRNYFEMVLQAQNKLDEMLSGQEFSQELVKSLQVLEEKPSFPAAKYLLKDKNEDKVN